jgi:nitrogen fixation protein FixH
MSRAMPVAPHPSGRWIPWLFVAFFAVVVVVNGAMIWIAVGSWTGFATNQAYDRGLQYNRNLAAARRQAVLGWRPELHARLTDGLAGEVELAVTDALRQPLAGADVVTRFERPTSEGTDFILAMVPTEPGTYRARFELPLAGVWNVHTTIRRGDDLFVHEQRLVLR